MGSALRETLRRHKAFWSMEPVDKPILITYPVPAEGPPLRGPAMRMPLADGSMAYEGMLLQPEMVSAERLHPAPSSASSEAEGLERLIQPGPTLATANAWGKIPWVEAIMGCPIEVLVQADTMWALPFLSRGWAEKAVGPLPMSEMWLAKLVELVEHLVRHSQGRYHVSTTLMRGPADMLAAAMGDELMCTSMYRSREETRRLLELCTELFIRVGWAQLEHIPRLEGGHVNMYGLWAPGSSIRTQNDSSSQLSPRLYEEFILPCDEAIARAFDYCVLATHSGGFLQNVDVMLRSESMTAIQVEIDPQPFGPPPLSLIPAFQKIQREKPLLIGAGHGLTKAEFEKLLASLSPNGLYISAAIRQPR